MLLRLGILRRFSEGSLGKNPGDISGGIFRITSHTISEERVHKKRKAYVSERYRAEIKENPGGIL